MWADVLTKPLQGQMFRDMRAFLQNCPRDYDDDVELQTDQLDRRSMNQQASKTVASSRECVHEHAAQDSSDPKPTSNNHKPQVPHACHESHGDQHKSHGSQINPTKTISPRDPTRSEGSHKVRGIPQTYRDRQLAGT
jgi:hypothetical protein